ncbi:MAG: aminopeptidase P family protein [Prevotella sp.]|nr:aminopeptidase P family protein [Prevotella sp.]
MNKLEFLREEMRREQLFACIFPTTDPHNSEYTADHWKGREWISGFTGSAGTAVVTLTAAALWTDSRYFIAAAQQLEGTEFQLMRERIDGTPTIAEWLQSQHSSFNSPLSTEVAIDGSCCTTTSVEALKEDLRQHGGLTLRTNIDLLQRLWTDRPAIPQAPIVPQPIEYTGEDVASKLTRIRQALRQVHADGMLMASLDDIAWTLNLRGGDVHCNPVFVSYLLISTRSSTLFVDERKLTPAARQQLHEAGVDIAPYSAVKEALRHYPEYNILADPDEVSYTLMQAVQTALAGITQRQGVVLRLDSPVPAMKAVKTQAEQRGFRQAMIRDGVALVRFLRWLKPAVAAGGQTEMSIDRQLTALRAQQPLYQGLSFDTIAAYQAHGAIVHYEATPDTDAPLRPEGLLLLDSGAQYVDGTTDITRTIALGPVTDRQRHIYTLVLKGHIQLQLLCFPDGASGTQLDAIARSPLWYEGLNFLHGTGHGVGAYLNVHEGPHQIRMEHRPAPLHAGMTVTDEPGIYLEGQFGVRIENVLLTQPARQTDFGRFLQFETLTLCPIDTAPLDVALLTPDERQWLNAYHQMVYDRLSPHLDGPDRDWLRTATAPIG